MNGRTSRRYAGIAAIVASLSAGGVGVYQLTSTRSGSSADSGSQQSDSHPLRVSDAARGSTLDAVTAAWESGSSPNEASVDPGDSPFVASSPVPPISPVRPSLVPDNQSDTPRETTPITVAPTSDQPTAVDASGVVGSRYAMALDQLPADIPLNPVARGQEPSDDESGASEFVNPFAVGDDDTGDADLQQRARAAFGDQAESLRYGNPSASATGASAALMADDPFSAQPPGQLPNTGTNVGSVAAPGATHAIESDQQVPGDFGQPGEQSGLPQQDRVGQRAAPPVDFDRAADSDAFDFGASGDIGFHSAPETGPTSGSLGAGPRGGEGIGRPGESALEGPQNAAIVVEKSAPPEIQVGKPATFRIGVRNAGNRPAAAVVVRDDIPEGTRLMSTTPRTEVVDGQVVWELGTLSAGEQRELEIQLMPTSEGEIGSVATITYAAQASVKSICTMPELALRLTAPRQVMIGHEQRVKIELHNPGSGDATGVILFENVPETLRHDSGPDLEFEVGTLRSGETREIELVLTAERPGTVVNLISARADGNLQVEQKIEFEVIAPALEVNVDGPRVRYLERPATYTVHVGNPGTAVAKDIELVTKLPKGMQFVRANNLGEYDAESHAVYWSLAELPEGEHGSVELVALPLESGDHEIKIEGKARQGLEDHTTQHVAVEGLAAIMFEVVDLKDPIEVGGETTYEIRVVNQGSKAASGVQVKALLPPGMQGVSAAGETRHAIQDGSVVFERLASLAPKAETFYRLQVQGVHAGDQRIRVEVDTDDIGEPIRKEESTRVFGNE